jgi:hypothetical protein
VLGYEKTDPVSFSVTINSTDSFILLYNEPYDEFWECNASDFRFVVNSINNGYLIEGNSSNQDIIITYIPETSLQLGLKISAAALVLTFVAVALILLIPKLSKRGNILMKRK